MGVAGSVPIIWSDMALERYKNSLIFGGLANRQYEGLIRNAGDSVKISMVGEVTVGNYTEGSDISLQTPDTATQMLVVDQQKYAAVTIGKIEEVQTNIDLMNEYTRELGYALANTADAFLAAKYTDAGITDSLGTTGTPLELNSADIIELFSDINLAMDENNVPGDGRVAVLPPWMIQKMVLSDVNKNTDNTAILSAGYRGGFMGFDIYMSNNVTKSGTSWWAPMFFRRGTTIAMASQITESVLFQPDLRFEDAIKMLNVYGAKVVKPDSLATVICKPKAEA